MVVSLRIQHSRTWCEANTIQGLDDDEPAGTEGRLERGVSRGRRVVVQEGLRVMLAYLMTVFCDIRPIEAIVEFMGREAILWDRSAGVEFCSASDSI